MAQNKQIHSNEENLVRRQHLPLSKHVQIGSSFSKHGSIIQQRGPDRSYQEVNSFEGSTFGSKRVNKYHQNKVMARHRTTSKNEESGYASRYHQPNSGDIRFEEALQSIDESQLGFVRNESATQEILRTHSEESEMVVTPS